MKKFLPHITIALLLLMVIFVPTNFVHAQAWLGTIAGAGLEALFTTTGLKTIVGLMMNIILQLTSFILGMTGLLLNQVLIKTVVNMSAEVSQMNGINIAWKVIRDLMNLGFIFLLIYYAILVIIG